ncbi:regulator of RNase E activity RraA [Lactobacillus colini]|uniref:Putative 4-hydroxy-4-methyl-2-oxoglutarate aldolase n=1 Tax=Lactobacillus colini TaxID=1819254 RepID=A0ABS4MDA9_9LACO|nr:RraA family protein [Lactobacillus colini]MBP2057678.1 regulator of RNase E activity RraA [Lactobacillus colini]
MPVGKRIYLKRQMPDPEVVKAYRELPASNVADCMERNSAMNPRIKLMSSPKQEMSGPAFTVHTRAGDNLAIYAALRYAHEGDVVVINDEGDTTRSLIGEVMMSYLRDQKKIAGIVVDGPIRDIDNLQNWDLPIYATSTTPGGPYKEGPGELNVPIACGNINVNPGDIILGDPDGVICIPRQDAAEILPRAQEFHKQDDAKAVAFSQGKVDLSWVDESLKEKGFDIINDYYGN